MLCVRVLGELELELDGSPVDPPASRRARSLLAMLALDGRRHARSQLAARFWPDVLDESARTSLRSALSGLRRSLGPDADRYLVATREHVGLADDVWTDAMAFERLAGDGRLQEAFELWRGDLLSGLDDDWVLAARDEWRERVAGVLDRLASEAEAAGDGAAAVAHTRRIVALDPLAEEGQRALIRRLAQSGDRAAAVAAYTRYAERLRTELRIAPSPATRALVDELRDTDAQAEPAVEQAQAFAGAAVAPRAPASGTVTLLFSDLVGSTKLLEELGDEQAERLRRVHFGLLRDVALSHAGNEVKTLGDGLMVAFGSSIDAAGCAIGIQQAVDRHNRRTGSDRLRVRVGLNVGEPIRDEDDYFGIPVVVAKRLCDRADGGQILTSDLVRLLIGGRGGFAFRPVGELELKGLAQPVGACELAWEPTARERIPLPAELARDQGELVGRDEELRVLEDAWRRARAGEPGVVVVAGEPGVGKTRLVAELCRRAHADDATILLGRSYEETLVPYQPFVEALRQYVSACPVDELRLQIGARRGVLAKLVPELADAGNATTGREADVRPEGEGERYALFDAVVSLVCEAARTHPAILVLDDLHWADDPSLLLLRHVARSATDAPLLILGTYRETEVREDDALSSALAELRRARALESLSLAGLGVEDVAELIRGRGTEVPDDLARAVAERTEGNPFFVEEIVRHLAGGGVELAVPESVKDLLRRRLKRLGEPARRALSAAAVLGREFDLDTLERVAGSGGDELLEAMDEALSERVLVESHDAVGRYAFAHALIRETIYEQLAAARRARLHLRAGEALEELHGERLDEHAGQLAHHFVQGGDEARSLDYQLRAARAAGRVYAAEAAVAHYGAALETGKRLALTADNDERLRRILLERGWLREVTGDHEAGVADYGRALETARAARDRPLEAEALDSLAFAKKPFDIKRAVAHHHEALDIAQQLGDAALQVRVLSHLSLTCSNRLDLAGALEAGERALELAQQTGDDRDGALAIDALKLAALQLGELNRLDELTAELEAIERLQGDLWYLQWTLLESSFVPLARASWDRATARLEEALAINHRIGDTFCGPLIHDATGWLERSRGRFGRALAEGVLAVELTEREGPSPWSAWTRATLGWTLLDLRAADDAVAMLERGVADARMVADRFRAAGHLAWAFALTGDDARADEAAREAERALAQLSVRSGGAFVFGFGAAAALARAHLIAGRPERGEALLAPLAAVAGRSGWHEAGASVSLVLALCHEARSQEEGARTLLRRAIELAEHHGLPGVDWEARAALARLSAGEEAARLRAESATVVERLAAGVGDARLAAGFVRAAER